MKLSKILTSCLLLASTSLFANQDIRQGVIQFPSEMEIDILQITNPVILEESDYRGRTIGITYSTPPYWSLMERELEFDFGLEKKLSLAEISGWIFKASNEDKISKIQELKGIDLKKLNAFEKRRMEGADFSHFVTIYDNIINEYISAYESIEKVSVKNLFINVDGFSEELYDFDKKYYLLDVSTLNHLSDSIRFKSPVLGIFVPKRFSIDNCEEGKKLSECHFKSWDFLDKNNFIKNICKSSGMRVCLTLLPLGLDENEAEHLYNVKAQFFADIHFKKIDGVLRFDYGVIKIMTEDEKILEYLKYATKSLDDDRFYSNSKNKLEAYGYNPFSMTDGDVKRIYNELTYDINNPKFIKEYKFKLEDIKILPLSEYPVTDTNKVIKRKYDELSE